MYLTKFFELFFGLFNDFLAFGWFIDCVFLFFAAAIILFSQRIFKMILGL